MKGIDVSAWQETINWQGLQEAGFEFVIVKLGERDKVSETFVDQVNAALANGFKIGVYYYAHATDERQAICEADFVAKKIREYFNVPPQLGVWYDVEDQSILEAGADVKALCVAFVERMHDVGIDYVGVYSSYNWLTNYIGALDGVPLWVAQYSAQDDYSAENPTEAVHLWQYTDHVSDDLPYDGNVCYVSV